MNCNSDEEASLLLATTTDDPSRLAQQAASLRDADPPQALALLQQAAQGWLRQGDPRRAALLLHRRAALGIAQGHSPVEDLALAARLLNDHPEDRALVLLDLGHALHQEGDTRRAALTLRASETLARAAANFELLAAARHALGTLADEQGDHATARDWLRDTGTALILDAESDLLATLRDVGNLPPNPRADHERARRQQALEDELAALKAELANTPPSSS